MVAFRILLAATVSRLVTAWPEPTAAPNLDNRGVNCAKVTGALSILKKLGPPATTFCSSYLKIPGTKTSTTTTTPAAVTQATSTTTVTVTSAACDARKRHARVNYRDIDFVRVDDMYKRDDKLALLGQFAAAKISEGCSCLNLQPKVTKTATFTAGTPTVQVVATATTCVVSQPTPPVCKPNGFGNTCTTGSQCCSGTCGATFDNTICCNPTGQACDLFSPDGCCSGICFNTGDLNDSVGTCIGDIPNSPA